MDFFLALGSWNLCNLHRQRSAAQKGDSRKVETVQWSVVIMQIVSMFLCCAPYGVYKLMHDQISGEIRHWYSVLGIPSAIILGIFFVAELVLMYLQAKQAQRSIINEVLSRRHHTTVN
ncbi:hypothetical protein OZX57_04550 [Bifidobacterium sp. ESL0682]|uniref:hypothetical protein n=1 Tax=Bifidobacterium sp. ESL0682 TaxID=2983212 RepID=UPI0023F7B208|nr:hypothetical protein [Bifidobacterium sp. ESL0682]WEV41348.1 hypothetical protein OZX57_04550 [Bifidobacterium sp. ESL0682]